jgi:hypothetical protein
MLFDQLKRRQLIALLIVATATWPRAAHAQQRLDQRYRDH